MGALDRIAGHLLAPFERPTLATFTDRLAATHGDRVAIVSHPGPGATEEITYTALRDRTARLSTALARNGVRRGVRVLLMTSNGAEYLIALLAIARAGAVAIPVGALLKPAEIDAILRRCGARVVLGDPATLPPVRDVVERAGASALSLGPCDGALDVAARASRVRAPRAPARAGRHDVIAVLYTSGTTGEPKGARLTSAGLLAALPIASLHPWGFPGSLRRAVTALPVAHVMGLVAALLLLGAGITNEMFSRFDARAVLDAIEHERADVFVGVPAMFRALLDAGAARRDLSSTRVWVSAADVLPADVARRILRLGRFAPGTPPLLLEVYGMVEVSGAAMMRVRAGEGATVGWLPVPPARVRVVDTDGKPVARGTVGRLAVRGPGVMAGYDRHDARIVDGWLVSEDLARAARAGAFELIGRARDMIKVGGYSVYPVEVEEEIRSQPSVADVAVIGVPDRKLGQVPVAAIVPAPGARPTAADLERWAHDAIASYRRPRRWLIVDELPRVATTKVDKTAVAELFRS